MSTQNSKKRKSDHKNIITKNEHAEDQKSDVLVVPPDFLQKMGINIKLHQHNIEINPGTSTKSNEFPKTEASEFYTENKYIQNDEKESSILETANLMKASVFLSPTFSSLKENISLDKDCNSSEICIEEIISKSTDIVESYNQNEHCNNKDELADEMKNDNRPMNGNKEIIYENEMQVNSIMPDYQNIDEQTSIKSLEEKTTNKEDILEFDHIKDLMLPATLISIHNKTNESNESTSLNIEDQSKKFLDEDNFSTKKKQLNVTIREEKYHSISSLEEYSSKLNEICTTSKVSNVNNEVIKIVKEKLDSDKCSAQDENVESSTGLENKLKSKRPVVEAKFSENSSKHNPKIQTNSKKIHGDLYLPTASKFINEIQNKPDSSIGNEENNSYNSYDTKQIGYKNNNLDEVRMTKDIEADSSIFSHNSLSISHQSVDNVDNKSSESKIPLSKVEEIAFYLNQHRQNSKTKDINTIQTTRNSKLCIQGVEKPGGDMKSSRLNRNIRTYSRRKNLKFSNNTSGLILYSEYKVEKVENIDYKINDRIFRETETGTKSLHNFCLCDDFGSFFNYDVNNNYGHIHFWERKEPQCSIEILLSIYEENNLNDSYEGNRLSILEIDNEKQQELSDDSAMNICWNYGGNILEKKNHECSNSPQKLRNINEVEFVVNENEQCEKVKTRLYEGKRKRVIKTSESDSESDKPIAKKATIAVKCGVCNIEVSKYEWNNHISKAHCFIAWQEGQEIDLENEDLLIKLNERICDTEKLICTFCELEVYDVKKFIQHVQKCKKAKYGGKPNDMTEYSEIVTDVPLALESEKEQISKESAVDIKSEKKQIAQIRKGQKLEIKQNSKEEKLVEVSVLQIVTDEQQETEPHLLQLVEMEQQQEVEVPILQIVEIVEDNEGEVPVLQVETGQVAEVNVLPKETGQKSVNQKQVPEVLASQVKIEPKPYCKGEKKVTCGVCKTIVCNSLWMEHITQEHNYIAWKDDETPLNCENEEDIRHYLNNIIKKIGELVCKICGLKRKFAKSYLKHIKNCQITEQSDDQESVQAATPVAIKTEKIDTENIRKFRKNTTRKVDTESIEEVNIKNINNVVKDKTRKSDAEHIEIEETENIIVKCGVCKLDISNAQWLEHICKEHDYMAWQEGEPEIDVNDSQQVHDHLFHVTKQNNGLTCKKCGLTRRYVKSYLNHITTCEGETDTVNSTLGSENVSILQANTIDTLIMDLGDTAEAKCGVCKLDVGENQWFNHAHKCHAYLAWKEGKPALDVDNEQEVQEYLYFVNKRFNGLICNKCGLTRKYVKVYLSHLESCESMLLDPSTLDAGSSNRDTYVCAVCSEEVNPKEWTNHAMNMHYNIAWAVGDYPVDLKNAGVIEKLLKAYQKQIGSFKCRICGIKRVSPMGFYVHIIQCGKTEEEIDKFRIFCELCNNKYLCFHKSQHAIMHRDQDLSKERKFKKEEKQENECLDVPKTEPFSERRRAAQKALKFIEKSETFAYNCSKCGYGADDEAELAEHDCAKVNYKDYSESEDSAQIESSGDESPESAVDSDLSAEERPASPERKRKSRGDTTSTKIPKKIPFAVKCANSYLKQSAEDYRNTFLTNGTLYPQWRSCNIELVADDQTASYLPTLKESCKVIIGRSDPVTYNLFEVKKYNGYSVFVGGCIQCISWAPPHVCDGSDALGHFLAVACHNDVDAPRLDHDRTYDHSGLLQIWDFGDLSSSYPEFALGIAHDYGTVWAIDWCPSGARDVPALQEDNELESTLDAFPRLGLLAIACSNGSAYILSVPYPSYVKKSDKNVYKLTPVAELRLSRGKTDLCQATSINWSQQNGHGTIVVGYSSGTVALYNLECDSPLLMENEGGVQIFYPFLDERPHSSCITDVKTFPSSAGAGLRSSVSPTGCEAAQLRGAARIHKHLSSDSCAFVPHWPALMLSGNELIVNQAVNELDLWGVGRRTGAVQKCCGCAVCGHVAAFTPPVVKLVTPHPAHADLNKEPIAVFQMRPLSRKRPKRKNDELQVVLEPRTYPDAVKLYALDFKLVTDLDRESAKQILKPREQYPERFPLSDIPSMAFYPSKKHHRKLAIATHAGVIFIINVDIAR